MSGAARGWTGGQYSLLRFCFGSMLILALAIQIHRQEDGSTLNMIPILALAPAMALGIGFRRRWAAVLLAILVLPDTALVLLLALHSAIPVAPYGSWDARGRVDPGGEWSMPRWLPRTAQAAVILGWAHVFLGPWPLLEPLGWNLGFIGLHMLALEPGWLPPRKRSATVFYDGSCGLCHRAIRGLIAEDPEGDLFRFAPLGGETFQASLSNVAPQLPDSLVVQTDEGKLHVQGQAIRFLMDGIGGWWRVGDMFLGVMPAFFRDRLYDLVAGNRYRVFGRQDAVCPLSPPDIRSRFLP